MFRSSDRDGHPPAPRVEVDLAAVRAALEQTAAALARDEGPALRAEVLARLAARLDEAGLGAPPPATLEAHTAGLDPVTWRWFALAAAALDFPRVRSALATLLRGRTADDVVQSALLTAARDVAATAPSDRPGWLATLRRWLTPQGATAVTRMPAVEVLARMVLAHLGASIAGEDDARAREVLAEVDHLRLLAELPRAREALKTAGNRLRQATLDQDIRLPPRGKW